MTLVLAGTSYWFTLLASDRLVTLALQGAFAGQHDVAANKSVVFMTTDGIVALGYTGPAYIGDIPTDQWLAQALWGVEIQPQSTGNMPAIRRGPRPGPRSLNASLLSVRRALAGVQFGRDVTVLATGWRMRRKRVVPVLISFSAWNKSGFEPDMRMRPPRHRRPLDASVGALLSPDHAEAAFREAPPAPNLAPEFADWLSNVYAAVIRKTSGSNPTVGAHTMSVIVTRPPINRVVCRFLPSIPQTASVLLGSQRERIPVAFSPWLVTDEGFNAATVMSGIAKLTFEMAGWSFEFCSKMEAGPPDAPAFFEGQSRVPRPGHRPRR